MKLIVCTLIVTVGGLLICIPAFAQKSMTTSPQALRGLSHVVLHIDYQGPADRPDGLTVDQLRDEIALRLNIAGLKVLKSPPMQQHGKTGELYLHVRTIPLTEKTGRVESYCYTLSIDLLQDVLLADRASIPIQACTWSEGSSIVAPRDELRSVTEMVGQLAGDFVLSFEAANQITEPEVHAIP
jgi:hypothetical protein